MHASELMLVEMIVVSGGEPDQLQLRYRDEFRETQRSGIIIALVKKAKAATNKWGRKRLDGPVKF